MNWFQLIFRLFEAYFACYKAIATYFICLDVCGILRLLFSKNSKIKFEFQKTPEMLKKVGMERVNEYVATYEHRVELKCVILPSLGRENE